MTTHTRTFVKTWLRALTWISATALVFAAAAEAQNRPVAEVRFTNPPCPSRPYAGYMAPTTWPEDGIGPDFRFALPTWVGPASEGSPVAVPLRDGTSRTGTVPGTYCFQSDAEASNSRPESVYSRLAELLSEAGSGDTISISTFSFSERRISALLCEAMGRGAGLTIVHGSPSPSLESLASGNCAAGRAEVFFKGSSESGRLQHSKYVLVERPQAGRASLSFQSANVTSGVSLHHENWSFVELPMDDALISSHRCHFKSLREAHFNDPSHGVNGFRAAFQGCLEREAAAAGGPLTSQLAIRAFFVPAAQVPGRTDGRDSTDALLDLIREADSGIDVIAHHLTYKPLLEALQEALGRGLRVRILLDDELFWVGNSSVPRDDSGRPQFVGSDGRPVVRDSTGTIAFDHYSSVALFLRGCVRGASFSPDEYETLVPLFQSGAEVRYIEANHRDSLFQHNKFVVTHKNGSPQAVFTGAGNLSSAAFSKNGENFYAIQDTALVTGFAKQYDHLWDKLATPPEKLPVTWATAIAGDGGWPKWRAVIERTKKSCAP